MRTREKSKDEEKWQEKKEMERNEVWRPGHIFQAVMGVWGGCQALIWPTHCV